MALEELLVFLYVCFVVGECRCLGCDSGADDLDVTVDFLAVRAEVDELALDKS